VPNGNIEKEITAKRLCLGPFANARYIKIKPLKKMNNNRKSMGKSRKCLI
jgi:hypothetical protein